MRTRNSFGCCPNYLIAIGVINLVVMISVSVIRYIYNLNVLANTLLYSVLSYEPYIEMFLDVFLFGIFLVICLKRGGKRDRLLMMVWGFVQVPMQIIYFISSNYYTSLISTMTDFAGTAPYVAFYASTHVLKYSMIFYITIFAIFVTGVSYGDRLLPVISLTLSVAYIVSFNVKEMPAITFPGLTTIGIVIPAFLYHLTESFLMIFAGLYLRIRLSVRKRRNAPTIENAIADTTRRSFKDKLFRK